MKIITVVFLIASIGTAYAQKLPPEWECAAKVIADAAKKSKDPSGRFSTEEQAEVDAATKSCMRHETAQPTLEQRLGLEIEEYLKCTLIASGVLDDGTSDAATIALGTRPQCIDHLQRLAKEPLNKDAMSWGESLHSSVVNQVLARRATLKAARTKSPPPRVNKQQM